MLLAILSGFIFALGLVAFGQSFRGKGAALSALLPFGLFVYFLSLLPEAAAGQAVVRSYAWAPSLGLELSFLADGLGLLFALIISGIGTLVFLFSASYLKGHEYLGRFYGYLSIFMASMLGLVLSDNILSLFLFWELTSISSFFLIGFNNEEAASRRAALVALGLTGAGGMMLLAGALVMVHITGAYSIQEMLSAGVSLPSHGSYVAILCLVFGAAFTKSAQFPFHFWLPGAMKAPTPVSAYLHSATMVKAGIYLLMRLSPLLSGHEYWHTSLIVVGGITMLYSGMHILFRTDLKSILAYSTITALGMLAFLIGIGTEKALLAAAVFVLVHALYKAALFLIAGIISHEAGTRDVTRLSGLGRPLLPVAIAGFLVAISSAGVPPTFGFVGKELIYKAALNAGQWDNILIGAAILASLLLFYGGFITGIRPFTGKLPEEFKKARLPSPMLWAPPALLALLSLLFGLAPQLLEGILIRPVMVAMGAGQADFHLELWHGFNLVLLLSGLTLAAGILLCWLFKPSHQLENRIGRFDRISPEGITEALALGFHRFSRGYTKLLQSNYLRRYVLIVISFILLLIGYRFFADVGLYINFEEMSSMAEYEVATMLLIMAAAFIVVFNNSRLVAVAAMGVAGYAICLLFVFYSAPDLAMTQFTIDTLTVILFVLVLYRLPKYLNISNFRARLRDGLAALSFGLLITVLALAVINEDRSMEVSNFYAEQAYLKAKGKNIVNVILVDFRGIDTLMEICVLSVAAIGVFSLLGASADNEISTRFNKQGSRDEKNIEEEKDNL